MIIRVDKSYETNRRYPKTDWYNDGSVLFVVDETTPEGKALANKIEQHYPYYEFVLDGEGNLIDIAPIDPPEPEPEEPEPTIEEILLTALMEIQELKLKVSELEGD